MKIPDKYISQAEAFARLLEIMDRLRLECPWDRKQTFESLRNLSIEEVYELADSILEGDTVGIEEEVGDILLHMVFYAKIGSETDDFNIESALNKVCEKLINRHPHIYGDVKADDVETVKKNWEQLKLAEGKRSVLSGVPNSLPAMVKAFRMQEKTAQVGFEWEHKEQVWAKVKEEVLELEEVLNSTNDSILKEEEFGDVLFSLINYARFEKIDPETALERINKKFKRRFEYIEQNALRPISELTLEEMDHFWNEAKEKEKKTV